MSPSIAVHPDRLLPADPAAPEPARNFLKRWEDLPFMSLHRHTDAQFMAKNSPSPDPARPLMEPWHRVTWSLHTNGMDPAEKYEYTTAYLPYNRLTILAFSLAVVAIAWGVLTKTRLGLFVRAVTQNRRMAACVGVKTARVDSYAFAFGAGIAGLGGCALSQIGNVGPDLGQSYIIDSFMVVVFGGVGNLWGTLVGAMSLGVLNKFLEPYSGAVLGKIIVLVLISARQKRARSGGGTAPGSLGQSFHVLR